MALGEGLRVRRRRNRSVVPRILRDTFDRLCLYLLGSVVGRGLPVFGWLGERARDAFDRLCVVKLGFAASDGQRLATTSPLTIIDSTMTARLGSLAALRSYSSAPAPSPNDTFANGTDMYHVEEMYRLWKQGFKSVHASTFQAWKRA
ncbi:hypothetical protein NMY22_g10317 [Coprinellus aureogranulatus]|nr:hypothetical protein NMY22_g10317 [Coprinellus aureogranulatus]